jgi:hypothetical protein
MATVHSQDGEYKNTVFSKQNLQQTRRKQKFSNFSEISNSSLFNEFVCKLGLFWHEWASLKRE